LTRVPPVALDLPAGLTYLRSQLKTGLIFARLRMRDIDPGRHRRNLAHAEHCLDWLVSTLPRIVLADEDRIEIENGIDELRIAIAAMST
jgi:hypothetical protein